MSTIFLKTDKKLPPLSEQEAIVARKLALGNSQKEIALTLHKSEHTINQQRRSAYIKTGSRNVADLTRWVMLNTFDIPEDSISEELTNL